jgi:hypothetical protein
MKTLRVLLPALVIGLASCQVAYYAAMEQFGIEKRDLLKKAVAAVRQDQKEAGKEFQDALTQLKALYGFNGGDLEKGYNKFKVEYEDCDSQAKTVSSRIKEMDRVARDLFREWEKEIGEISTPSLVADSRMKLSATRQRFQTLSANLHTAESSMTPVLRQFHDQVLYLKHNLNAAAIGSLRTNADGIQADIQSLLIRLDQSMREADAFIGTLK